MGPLGSSSGDPANGSGLKRSVSPSDRLVGATVLVVDDEEPNRRLLERMVGGHGGATVHTLADPRQTVDECRRLSPDILLLDLHMPEMDGVEVIVAVREQLQDISFLPIIVLTADVTSEAKERALAAGANDFLTKPFDHIEVLLRVGNLLETGTHFADLQLRNANIQIRLDHLNARESIGEALHQRRATQISRAFAPGSMHMVFQPIRSLADGAAVGVEALARFDIQPTRSPDKWFAEAASIGEGVRLELHAIKAALEQFPDLEPDEFMAFNTSSITALSPSLSDVLTGLPCERIVLELTEHVAVKNYPELLDRLDELRSRGVRIAMDDTGSGYSGLQHLLVIKPEIIKLDRALIDGIVDDPARRALASAMVSFADELGSTVVAEGIETADDLDTLRSLGVHWGQGYHLGRPAPLSDRV
jgi:EAL domain-containing protein (putative c-di-GMP-specific phosphodiesterase class I)/DNA-binding response OmpR family regulator